MALVSAVAYRAAYGHAASSPLILFLTLTCILSALVLLATAGVRVARGGQKWAAVEAVGAVAAVALAVHLLPYIGKA